MFLNQTFLELGRAYLDNQIDATLPRSTFAEVGRPLKARPKDSLPGEKGKAPGSVRVLSPFPHGPPFPLSPARGGFRGFRFRPACRLLLRLRVLARLCRACVCACSRACALRVLVLFGCSCAACAWYTVVVVGCCWVASPPRSRGSRLGVRCGFSLVPVSVPSPVPLGCARARLVAVLPAPRAALVVAARFVAVSPVVGARRPLWALRAVCPRRPRRRRLAARVSAPVPACPLRLGVVRVRRRAVVGGRGVVCRCWRCAAGCLSRRAGSSRVCVRAGCAGRLLGPAWGGAGSAPPLLSLWGVSCVSVLGFFLGGVCGVFVAFWRGRFAGCVPRPRCCWRRSLCVCRFSPAWGARWRLPGCVRRRPWRLCFLAGSRSLRAGGAGVSRGCVCALVGGLARPCPAVLARLPVPVRAAPVLVVVLLRLGLLVRMRACGGAGLPRRGVRRVPHVSAVCLGGGLGPRAFPSRAGRRFSVRARPASAVVVFVVVLAPRPRGRGAFSFRALFVARGGAARARARLPGPPAAGRPIGRPAARRVPRLRRFARVVARRARGEAPPAFLGPAPMVASRGTRQDSQDAVIFALQVMP